MVRLFVAVELGEGVLKRTAEAIDRVRHLAPDAKWVNPNNAHVTLVFLGHLPDEQVPQVQTVVEAVAKRHSPLELTVRGAGTFGTKSRPRVLWVGLGGDVAPLGHIKAELQERFIPFGHEPEKRPFSPHLTLARARDLRGDARLAACRESLGDVSLGTAQVLRLVLFQSKLSPKGATYVPLIQPLLCG